ncbi:MAG: FitA-like ribbon-helix-helix domain-containing protein [Spirochaetota bacterium]
MINCTIRNIPDVVEERLREVARTRNLSLDQAALEILARGLGLDVKFEYQDLEYLPSVTEDGPAGT